MQAFASFTAALKIQPRHVPSLHASGLLYQNCSMLPEAQQALRLALSAAPADDQIKAALANTLTDYGALLSRLLQPGALLQNVGHR